ncbi:MAG: coaE [Gammaproteobacteria bacterium]|nr:coaE [Gammaproteobacteria bacterium]
MLVIGLTGGIASGKSTAAHYFVKHSVPLIDTDQIARELVTPEQPAFNAIAAHFASSVLNSDGSLNRKHLRHLIFSNEKERRWLEDLLHPLIREQVSVRLKQLSDKAQQSQQTIPYCIVMIPLLVESQAYAWLDRILVIDSDEITQCKRLQERDGMSLSECKAILSAQISRQKRLGLADDIIDNNEGLLELEAAVAKQHKAYLQLAETSGNAS